VKKAFSLIEVIFSIIIVAISLMSVPMLLKQSSKSDEYSVIQEGVLAATTTVGNILSYPWDGNSFDSTNKVLRVLDVAGGDSELDRDLTTLNSNYRKGHVVGNQRRRFFDFSSVGKVYPGVATDSISAFDGVTSSVMGGAGTSGAYDYKDSALSINSKVFYIADSTDYSLKNITFSVNPATIANSTNIKMIEINTTSPLLGKSFIIRTFSCNLGQAGLLSRIFP